MKIRLMAAAIFIQCLLSLSAFAVPAEDLTKLLSTFTTLQTDFSQTTTDATQQVLQKSSGVMYVKKPNHFRFETNDPTHQIVFMDGKTVWIYDMDLQQATRQAIAALPMNPAKLLSGDIDTFLKNFQVTLQKKNDFLIFKLIPQKSTDAFRNILISFKQDKLNEMRIENNMGQFTVFSFSNLRINPPLSNNLFQFSPPAGVDVLH